MKPKERVLRALEYKETDIIPYYGLFSSMEAIMCFLGTRFLEANDLEKTIFLARFLNSDIANIPVAGFPGGPGIFEEILYEGKEHLIAKTPFGGLLYWRKKPYFALPLSCPIRYEEDLNKIEKFDIEKFKPKAKILAEKVQKLHELGYFVTIEIKGPMESPWMYLRGGYNNFLIDIKKSPVFASRLIELAFKPMLELVDLIIDEAHIDAVWMTDDLGDNRGPFISVENYRTLIKPWHEEITKRVHKKDVKLCLHSHGNIMLLLKDMVETNPDSIDPLDPADGMNIDEIKEKYYGKICFMGAITKNIGLMSKNDIEGYFLNVSHYIEPTGFILMPAGGIPPEMSLENFNYYNYILDKTRRKYEKR